MCVCASVSVSVCKCVRVSVGLFVGVCMLFLQAHLCRSMFGSAGVRCRRSRLEKILSLHAWFTILYHCSLLRNDSHMQWAGVSMQSLGAFVQHNEEDSAAYSEGPEPNHQVLCPQALATLTRSMTVSRAQSKMDAFCWEIGMLPSPASQRPSRKC